LRVADHNERGVCNLLTTDKRPEHRAVRERANIGYSPDSGVECITPDRERDTEYQPNE
jgi:hypothetical protein